MLKIKEKQLNVKVDVTGEPIEHDKWECEICQENMREDNPLLNSIKEKE